MPQDSNGIWQYAETDAEATASDLLNLGQASVSTAVGALRARAAVLEQPDSDFAAIPLASGWAADGTGLLGYRLRNGSGQLSGARIKRTANLAVGVGVGYTVATLPAGGRPNRLIVGVGAIGGLGPAAVLIGTDGNIQIVPLMAGGTITTAGGWGNSATLGPIEWKLA